MSSSLLAVVARQHGVVTVDALVADGFGINSIRRGVTRGQLVLVHRGVYRLASAADSFEAKCVAASMADSSFVITGTAGGRLWEFRHVPVVDRPIVVAGPGRRALCGPLVIRRSNDVRREDVVERPDGIRLANPVRTWFDCAQDLSDDRFEALTEWVLDRHATMPTLWAMARRLGKPGRTGAARVRRVLSRRPAWQKPADSRLELRVLKALEARGVGPLVRQHTIRLPNRLVIHPDGALPDLKWAVEVDHVTWHGGRFEAQRDKGRDRQLRQIDWQVDRVTDLELRDDFAGTIDELVGLVALRRRQLAA